MRLESPNNRDCRTSKGMFQSLCHAKGLFSLGFIIGAGIFLTIGLETLDRTAASTADPSTQIKPLIDPRSPTGFSRGMRVQTLDQCWDGFMWIMLAQEASEKGVLRLRHTQVDNGPEGREVHWSQSVMWLLRLSGWIHAIIFSVPLGAGIEAAALWVMPLLFIFLVTVFGLFTRRELGEFPAAVFVLALFICGGLSSYMTFGQADHHGMVAMAIVFSVLTFGLAFERNEALRDDSFRSGRFSLAILSGVSMGIALWISASSALPVIIGLGVGIASAIAFCWPGNERLNARGFARCLRHWSRAGAFTSFCFYLVEYFPSHFGWRLEVNHPLYALSWVGGGELLARFVEWRGAIKTPWVTSKRVIVTFVALVAVAATPLVFLFFSKDVFLPAEPFVFAVHKNHISEFQSIQALTKKHGWIYPAGRFACPLAVIVTLWMLARDRSRLAKAICFTMPMSFLCLMSCLQVRWGILANAFAIGYLPFIAQQLFGWCPSSARRQMLGALTVAMMFGFFAALQLILAFQSILKRSDAKRQDEFANRLVVGYRWVAHEIAERMPPHNRATILSSPSITLLLTYFAGATGLGTYYWENASGLKAADALFLADTEETFENLVHQHRISHIVIPSDEMGYLLSEGLCGLPRRAGRNLSKSYLARVVMNETCPTWLNLLAAPSSEGVKAGFPIVIEVRRGQTRAEQLVEQADVENVNGRQDVARKLLMEAFALDPSQARAVVRLALMESEKESIAKIIEEAKSSPHQIANAAIEEARRYSLPLPRPLEILIGILSHRQPDNGPLKAEFILQQRAKAFLSTASPKCEQTENKLLENEFPIKTERDAIRIGLANALTYALNSDEKSAENTFAQIFSLGTEADLPVSELREIIRLMATVRRGFVNQSEKKVNEF